jgi:6-phosphogluconate dehydrogenase
MDVAIIDSWDPYNNNLRNPDAFIIGSLLQCERLRNQNLLTNQERDSMELGMIGLGRMGANMTERLVRGGHRVVGFARTEESRQHVVDKGAESAVSLEALTAKLKSPRTLWLMVPAGATTDATIDTLLPLLKAGDTLIDGGNSNYKDTLRRAKVLAESQVQYIDCGTSGGIWGLKEGYSLMIGGDEAAVERMRPIFTTLAPAPDRGWGRVGPVGSGHFTKMIHNGIEYGMMQAFAEGFSILQHKQEFRLDLHQIAEIWRSGSVVRSWLLDLTSDALKKNPTLKGIAPWVEDSGEGRWTVSEAIDLNVPAPVITLSLLERLRSRDPDSFSDKLLAAMRNEFGGHAIKSA